MVRVRNTGVALFTVVILAILSLATATPANSEENPGNYAKLAIGRFAPTGVMQDRGYDPAQNGEVLLGHYFSPVFALEGGIVIMHSEGAEKEPYSLIYIDRDLNARGWVLTPKFIYPGDGFEVYAGIGIGRYRVTDEAYTFGPGGDYIVNDSLWGYHAIAGASYNVTQSWYLGLESKYARIPDFLNAIDVTGRTIGLVIGLRF